MSMKIECLAIQNFRGIRRLQLDVEAKNLIVVGENGSGKSSIIDALEYYFTGSLEKLTGRADVKAKESIPHLKGGPTHVEMRFTGAGQPFAVPYPRGRINVPSQLRTFFTQANERPFVLRRAQILDFVNARPAKRYAELSKIVGLGDLDRIDDLWRKQRNEAAAEVERHEQAVDQVYEELGETLITIVDSEPDLLEALNEWLLSAPTLDVVRERADVPDRIKKLRTRLRTDPEREVVATLRGQQTDIAGAQEMLDSLLKSQSSLVDDLRRYWRKSEVIDDAAWERLLVEGRRLLQDEPDLADCPLCENPISDRRAFLSRLNERVEAMEELTRLRRTIHQSVNALAGTLNAFNTRLDKVHAAFAENDLHFETTNLDAVKAQLASWREELHGDRLPAQATLRRQEDETIRELRRLLQGRADEVAKRLEALAWDDQLEDQYELLQKLIVVDEQWQRLEAVQERLARARYAHRQVSIIYDELIAARRRGVDRLCQALQEDFDRFYQELHPDEGYEQIAIAPYMNRRGSVELTARFHDHDPAHPLGFWSEGHLDSLGLCIFLAFISRFAGEFKVIALDDVLTTVDAGHRLRVAQLLAREFASHQIIITTHDRLWARQLQSILHDSRLIPLKSWTLEQGADFQQNVLSDWEYYEAQARDGRPQDTVAGAGRNLEKFLYQMRSNLGLAVPARPNEAYTIGDLLPPFLSWVKSHSIERADRRTFRQELGGLLDELEHVWRLRNWAGAHFNEWAMTLAAPEAIRFLQLVRELVACFACPVCSNLVVYNRGASALICPVCQPKPPDRAIWNYDSDWVGRAERMKEIDAPPVRHNLRNMAAAQFSYFLQDMRLRVGLTLPVKADDAYSADELYAPFLRWAREHPRKGYGNWPVVLDERNKSILAFRHNGDWRIEDEAAPTFVDAVCEFITLFTCDTCGQPANYDGDHDGYVCHRCDRETREKAVSAFWFVE